MSITKEAGEVLVYIYNNRHNSPSSFKIAEDTKKDLRNINEALDYLEKDCIIQIGSRRANGNRCSIELEPIGVRLIENKPEFKHTFGFEVNLGLFRVKWGASEK